jgi:hypothetical protein
MDNAGNRRVLTTHILILDVTPPLYTPKVPGKASKGDTIILSVKDVDDPSGIASIKWTITGPDGDQQEADGRNATFEPWMDGDYRIRINVTDNMLNSAQSEHWITATGFEEEERSTNWPFMVMLGITLFFGALLLLYLFRDKLLPEQKEGK